jgi:diaminohydroxyphosphoribosylaminopyrimidine deaminase / 5-amino-6-(5-phosphoribosylamino)uracil reductase
MNEVGMIEAIKLGSQARGMTAPNPMVGAVVVNEKNEVIGRGFHPKAGDPHAEVFAIRDAKTKQNDLSGCTLFVTLEPCNHHGRTPPCLDLVLSEKIKKVRVGALDPNPLMQGKSIQKLKDAGVDVKINIEGATAEKLIRGYKSVMLNARPYVSLKCATSLDGKIATRTGESQWITEPPARQLAHIERAEHDAIMVGVGTVIADDPQLNVRLDSAHAGLKKIILDSRLRTPVNSKLFSTSGPVIIYCDSQYSGERKLNLEKAGATIVPPPGSNATGDHTFHKDSLDLNTVLKDLAKRGVQELMVEGGARVLGAFVREKLFDRLVYIIAPKILGSESRDVFEGLNIDKLKESVRLENISTRLVGTDIIIEGTRPCLPA